MNVQHSTTLPDAVIDARVEPGFTYAEDEKYKSLRGVTVDTCVWLTLDGQGGRVSLSMTPEEARVLRDKMDAALRDLARLAEGLPLADRG